MIWHSATLEEVKNQLRANEETGLHAEEVRRRQEEYGPNRLREDQHSSVSEHFAAQLKNAPTILFFVAAILSLCAIFIYPEDAGLFWLEPIVSILLVLLYAVWSALRAKKAEKALDTLHRITIPMARVIRDGIPAEIPADQLVPGDLIVLKTGDYIPADARLTKIHALRCDESSLTGEEVPVEKQMNPQLEDISPISHRLNMVFSGCAVTFGEGEAIVTDIAMDSELGKKAAVLSMTQAEKPPLQEDIQKVVGLLTPAVLIFSGILLLIGLLKGIIIGLFGSGNLMTLAVGSIFSISTLALCIYPTTLAITAMAVLAAGIGRIHKQNAIIRTLSSAGTLAKVSVLCCEKTDCFTTGEMTLQEVFNGKEICRFTETETPDEGCLTVVRWAALGCEIDLHANPDRENATDAAILNAAEQYCGLSRSDALHVFPQTVLLPFDPNRRMMSSVNVIDGAPYAVVKGAPEIVLSKCTTVNLEEALAANTQMGDAGLRVIAIGVKPLEATPANPLPEELECDLTFVGLIGLLDPPLPQAAEQVAACKKAGIIPVMVTGDHLSTASALAQHIGILTDDTVAITGSVLAQISDEDLDANIEKYTVYARVTPHDKRRIVKAWQNHGNLVAITGERVDDDATLQLADVGCALGKSGTDVAKEASDLVLCDDRFPTLVKALSEARTIYANLRRSVQFLFTTSLALAVILLVSTVVGNVTAPMLHPIQMVTVVLLFGGALAFALGLEPDSKDMMLGKTPTTLFSNGSGVAILWQGILLGILTIIGYYMGVAAYTGGGDDASGNAAAVGCTMAFSVLTLGQLMTGFQARSEHSLFHVGIHTNLPFLAAALLNLLIFLALHLVPWLRTLFGLVRLTESLWEKVIILALIPLVAAELYKLVQFLCRKYKSRR